MKSRKARHKRSSKKKRQTIAAQYRDTPDLYKRYLLARLGKLPPEPFWFGLIEAWAYGPGGRMGPSDLNDEALAKRMRQAMTDLDEGFFGMLADTIRLVKDSHSKPPVDSIRLRLIGALAHTVARGPLTIRELSQLTGCNDFDQMRRLAKEFGLSIKAAKPGRPKNADI